MQNNMDVLQSLGIYTSDGTLVAVLGINDSATRQLIFKYDDQWLQIGFPLSPFLSFDGNYGHLEISNFLQNLLPESDAFFDHLNDRSISRRNLILMLKEIGADSSGAFMFKPLGYKHNVKPVFKQLDVAELASRVRSGTDLAVWDGELRLSVAGMQDKLNLLKRLDGQLGFGEGSLCSNHIYKFESKRAPGLVVNEYFCMMLAKRIGFYVADVDFERIGGIPALAVVRFDRKLDTERGVVYRRHVIDGCQATNKNSEMKYERNFGDEDDVAHIRDGVSFPLLFSIDTVDNLLTQQEITKWMIFNLCTFNYDAHGKNISFFVNEEGLSLAPFYDLVNIEAMKRYGAAHNSRLLGRENSAPQYYAMSIGDWSDTDKSLKGNFKHPISAFNLAEFCDAFGISALRMRQLIESIANSILENIDFVAETVLAIAEVGENEPETEIINIAVSITKDECQRLLEEAKLIEEMLEYV
ncbi:HipA domain-containing protein [Photobacterium leiognathi]|uniref:HipA domain-containing protein n=1 Tax=Photobacterium leiognathi TaxID=553611 RepID=UPI002737425E|nr:HipA domain-containing protein [Photobacterium leiognathi]